MKEQILKHFLQIDIYGTEPRFTINGEKKFNTYFGSFMTLVSFSIISLFFFMYTHDVIYHTNPKLITTIYSDTRPAKRYFKNKNFVFTLSIQHQNYSNFINEKIYNIKAGIYNYHNGDISETKTLLDVIKCSDYNFEVIPEYFHTLDLSNLYCLKDSTFEIEGEYQSESFQYLYFSFSKCKNSTFNNNSCESEEIINSVLKGGYIGIFMSDNIIIPNNFSVPFQTYGKNLFTSYSVNQYTDFWIYFKPMEVLTDSGLFFKKNKKELFIAYDRAEGVVDYRNSENFAFVGLRESNKREVYERSYTKIQEAAASAGGIVKIITLICNFIVYFFRQILYQNFMSQFFKFKKKDESNPKIRDTQSVLHQNDMKNVSDISNINPSKVRIFSVKSIPRFHVIRNRNSSLSVNNFNNNNSGNNCIINNSINNTKNNTNNNLFNNSNNIISNNINNNSNNINVFNNNFNRKSIGNKIIPQRRETSISVISGLNNYMNDLQSYNKVIRVKPSRNCCLIFFRKGCFKKISIIKYNFSKIDFLFDIVQYFKIIFEVRLIKNRIFDEEQRDKISHIYKFNYEFDADKDGYDVFYKKKDPFYSSRSSQFRFKNPNESVNYNLNLLKKN